MSANSKKYYWIKLKTDFFNQETIDFLLSQKNGCEYIVLYQMLCLQTANNNGIMATKVGEIIMPYDINKIVRDTKYFDYDTVAVALELFKQLGLIYEEENKILKITNLEEMVGSETPWAEKKRLYREKQKLLGNSQDKVEDNVREEIRDKSIDINNNIINNNGQKNKIYEERFELFYKEYPRKVKRKETLNWFIKHKPSEELFNNIMSKLKEYKKIWEKKEKNYIPHPTTWLNQERWEDEIDENIIDDGEVKLVRSGENSFHIGG